MLHHPTLEKLQQLRLAGMHKALSEQAGHSEITALSFEERLGLLADRELTERENRRLKTRLRQARLKHNACIEDIDYRAPRGLDKALLMQLATCRWIHEGLNLIIVRPTGGQARPGLPVPWLTRPPVKATGSSIYVSRDCSRSCTWPTVTGAFPS